MDQKLITAAAVTVITVAGVAYLIFLVLTWNQLQQAQTDRYSRIDGLLDTAARKAQGDDGS